MRISDVTFVEGADAVFTVDVTGPHPGLSVDYATAEGSAFQNEDYLPTSGTLSIPASQTDSSTQISVRTASDNVFEPNESFGMVLSNSIVATIVKARGQATLENDDPFPSVSVRNRTITEPDAGTVQANFSVVMSNPASAQVTVNYATEAGTAISGVPILGNADFDTTEGQLVFPAFDNATQQISVPVHGDLVHEADETFLVKLSDPINARLGDRQALGTITNEDDVPELSIFPESNVKEGDDLTRNIHVRVFLSNPTDTAVTFDYSTSNGSAVAPQDYVEVVDGSGSLVAHSVETTVLVTLKSDDFPELDKNLFIIIDNPTNAVLGSSVHEMTILNDDDFTDPFDPFDDILEPVSPGDLIDRP
jgi:hypothetical protein